MSNRSYEWLMAGIGIVVIFAFFALVFFAAMSTTCGDGYVMLDTEHARGCVPFEEYKEIK